MIKIFLPVVLHDEISYEGVWVEELSSNTGAIDNLPVFARQYKFKDVIEFDPETRTANRVIRDGGYTATEVIRYKGEFEDAKTKWENDGYIIEGWDVGLMALTKKRANSG